MWKLLFYIEVTYVVASLTKHSGYNKYFTKIGQWNYHSNEQNQCNWIKYTEYVRYRMCPTERIGKICFQYVLLFKEVFEQLEVVTYSK